MLLLFTIQLRIQTCYYCPVSPEINILLTYLLTYLLRNNQVPALSPLKIKEFFIFIFFKLNFQILFVDLFSHANVSHSLAPKARQQIYF